MFLCNTLSVWEDQDEVAVVLVEVAEERVDKLRKMVTLIQKISRIQQYIQVTKEICCSSQEQTSAKPL